LAPFSFYTPHGAFFMAKKKQKKEKDIFKFLEKQFEEMEQERLEKKQWANPGPSNIGGKKRYWTNGG